MLNDWLPVFVALGVMGALFATFAVGAWAHLRLLADVDRQNKENRDACLHRRDGYDDEHGSHTDCREQRCPLPPPARPRLLPPTDEDFAS